MRWRLGVSALLLAGTCFSLACLAQTGPQPTGVQQIEPQGVPQAAKPVADTEFGVGTRQLGLQRNVEMYQWRASGTRYEQAWSNERIDSKTFAPGHENPPQFPLQPRQWIADDIFLDGKSVDPAVLKALARWHDYRPDFSALPGNLSATFQPEGDGLGSAINPLDPQVGDLRITWQELTLPSLKGAVAMNNGVWMLAQTQSTLTPAVTTTQPGDDSYSKTEVGAFVGAGLLLVLILLAIYMKKRRR
ncbi:MAG: TMEM43 family protein [Pseudomonadota bacterium]|nr:TMEM43 family protein [Pseudomonadota bacterium]MDQ3229067.1 TMEM43 family protein [Pseudomonadota bacterium]